MPSVAGVVAEDGAPSADQHGSVHRRDAGTADHLMVTAPLITPSMIDLPSVGKAARQPDQIIKVILQKR